MSNVVSETANTSGDQWNIPWWATLVQGLFSIVVVIYGLYFLLAGLMVVLSLLLYKDF